MRNYFLSLLALTLVIACSNSSEFATGEIKAIKNLKDTLLASKTPTKILDTRNVINRKKIDDAKIPVLFLELENGQNGTLTLYPGEGVGETWLGADGATVTLEYGFLKATRGMKNDLMGSISSKKPLWADTPATENKRKYKRQLSYLGGDNLILTRIFSCQIERDKKPSSVIIFELQFKVRKYTETCHHDSIDLQNIYFVDNESIVRKSRQYHSPALGYITVERLDR